MDTNPESAPRVDTFRVDAPQGNQHEAYATVDDLSDTDGSFYAPRGMHFTSYEVGQDLDARAEEEPPHTTRVQVGWKVFGYSPSLQTISELEEVDVEPENSSNATDDGILGSGLAAGAEHTGLSQNNDRQGQEQSRDHSESSDLRSEGVIVLDNLGGRESIESEEAGSKHVPRPSPVMPYFTERTATELPANVHPSLIPHLTSLPSQLLRFILTADLVSYRVPHNPSEASKSLNPRLSESSSASSSMSCSTCHSSILEREYEYEYEYVDTARIAAPGRIVMSVPGHRTSGPGKSAMKEATTRGSMLHATGAGAGTGIFVDASMKKAVKIIHEAGLHEYKPSTLRENALVEGIRALLRPGVRGSVVAETHLDEVVLEKPTVLPSYESPRQTEHRRNLLRKSRPARRMSLAPAPRDSRKSSIPLPTSISSVINVLRKHMRSPRSA